MSAELDEKWRELVAAGRANWAPGMRARTPGMSGYAIMLAIPSNARGLHPWWTWGECLTPPDKGVRPDWTDPATLGALLGQVRARYMDPTIYARPQHVEDGHGWTLYDALGVLDLRGCPRSGPDEVSALLRGLELAP